MVTHPHTNCGQCCLTCVMKPANKAGLPPKQKRCYEDWKEEKWPKPSTVDSSVTMNCKTEKL